MLTATPVTEVECTSEDFILVRDFIHEKSGIYFPEYKMNQVRSRLLRRLQDLQIKSMRDYYYHVKYDTSLREFQQLMNIITTNETSFFRNTAQLYSFASEAIPTLMQRRIKRGEPKTLRIWSAGCSTGEEPYTLAIQLLEALRSFPGWSFEIIANDISEDVLAKARLGEYSGTTIRPIPTELLSRYFSNTAEGVKVNQEVRGLVKFSHLNLNDSRKLTLFSGMDVIFCRNVMCSFSEEVKRRLARGIYAALRPGGYFYIDQSESLHGVSKSFRLAYFKDALVYQKVVNESVATIKATSKLSSSSPATIQRREVDMNSASSRALDLLQTVRTSSLTSPEVRKR